MRRLFSFFATLCLVLAMAIPAMASVQYADEATSTPASDGTAVIDEADLLTDDEEGNLEDKIDGIRSSNQFDIVIVTVTDMYGKTDMEYADDYYDYNGYGCGDNHDGCLLLIHMDEDRGYWISTTGEGISAMSDYDIQCIGDDIVPYLSDGDYYGAFDLFVDDVYGCISSVDEYGNYVEYFDDDEYYRNDSEDAPLGRSIIYGIGAGFVLALLVVSLLTSQLKSVRSKASASDYYVENSMRLTGAYDSYVGTYVTKTERPKNNSSGGSSTHSGSSGTSHGGGGGHF